MNYVAPEVGKAGFHCPHCNMYANQVWFNALHMEWIAKPGIDGRHQQIQVPALLVARCSHCSKYSIWLGGILVAPEVSGAPLPHPEMPDDIKSDFDEARRIFARSPRSSAALLRLAIQKLCIHLGHPGRNLNDDIGRLVENGLPVQIQRSLDIVRVVGNNQVHPGTLDVRDDPETATRLFELVNLIVEDRISRPKQIEALYLKLPEGARKQVEERDAKVAKTP